MKEIKVPKYLEERFDKLEEASDLIDNCKYLLYFSNGWGIDDGYEAIGCYPVRSKQEAIQLLREAVECGYDEENRYVPLYNLKRGA